MERPESPALDGQNTQPSLTFANGGRIFYFPVSPTQMLAGPDAIIIGIFVVNINFF